MSESDDKRMKAEFLDYQLDGITRRRLQVEFRVQKHMYRPLVLDGRCQLSCIILDRKHAPSFWTGLPGSRR